MIRITPTSISFDQSAIELLRLKNKSEVLFCEQDKRLYLANVTDHYKRGYSLNKRRNRLNFTAEHLVNKLDLTPGEYVIDNDYEFDEVTKIDWYYITPRHASNG